MANQLRVKKYQTHDVKKNIEAWLSKIGRGYLTEAQIEQLTDVAYSGAIGMAIAQERRNPSRFVNQTSIVDSLGTPADLLGVQDTAPFLSVALHRRLLKDGKIPSREGIVPFYEALFTTYNEAYRQSRVAARP